ncbi:MAG: glycosyltransferase, partial [Chloroflexi bacterium]|nr:glycosyltransferase [Chloroflexota bacterium]
MRLALIRQRYNPFGGTERFIERAIAALERGGAEVTMITRAWDAVATRRAILVDPPHVGRLWRDVSFSNGVCEALKREHFDLVQSHERIAGCD